MANHKSAEKRMRQTEKRKARNTAAKSHVKTRIKKVLSAVEGKNVDASKEELLAAVKVIDKAAAKGVLHRNNAARKVSRLTKKVNSLS